MRDMQLIQRRCG